MDFENQIIQLVADAIGSAGVRASFSSEDNPNPATFPHVSIVLSDDYTYRKTVTVRGEQHAQKMISINTYTNNESGRKEAAKAIADIIDGTMKQYGFIRTSRVPMSSLNNASIYRIAERFVGIVGSDGIVYQ